MKKAVIYARVSSKMQAEDGLSIDAQINQLREYAVDNGYEILNEYVDKGESAKTADRPEFQQMIRDIKGDKNSYDAVLIHKTDRFARNREDSIVYKSLLRRDCGVDVIAIKEDFGEGPIGKMIEGILEVIAEFYSENLAREVKKGQVEKAKKGQALGEPPYGYIIGEDGKFKIYEPEAEVVRYIFNRYLEGDGSHTIADKIKEIGIKQFGEAAIKKTTGKELNWSSNRMVLFIIKNEVYTGLFEWDDIIIEDNHPAIISKEEFELAQELRDKKKGRGCGQRNMYLLKGLLKCYECNSNLGRKNYKSKGKTVHVSYCMNNRINNECYSNRNKMADLEKHIIKSLEKISKGITKINNLTVTRDDKDQNQKQIKKLQKKLEEFDKQFDRQMEAFEAGVINIEQLKKYKTRLNNQKDEVKNQIVKLKDVKKDIDENKFRNKINNVVTLLKDESININKKRLALLSIIKEVRVSRKNGIIKMIYKW
ncbi:site-specific DNA recombinase [Orenia metallireducens]|uniref:Site-specific DNA recombinase n=1 Tax=Orenia metallireducens TaxID=1413210 RepID=A0A285G6I1_9FIRM|nr:recombinase family protein [Orenia metallireducens]SNY19149.1 site-specific DNA recombinase [Orenia metallireducens]